MTILVTMKIVVAIAAVFLEYAIPMAAAVALGFLLMALLELCGRYRLHHPALEEFLYRVRVRLLSCLHYFEDRADWRFRRARRGDSIWKNK